MRKKLHFKKSALTLSASLISFIFTTNIHAQSFNWSSQFGGTSADVGLAVTTDAVGNVYNTGYFVGTVDFDPSPATSNLINPTGEDVFISKHDALGNYIWAKQLEGINLSTQGRAIAVDGNGNVYTTGTYMGTVDFDPGASTFTMTAAAGGVNIFISKLDASGNFVWAKSLSGSPGGAGTGIVIDASGNVYITGYFASTVDFDPNAGVANITSNGQNDAFICKLTSSGNFVWAQKLGGSGHDLAYGIALDASGNVHATGYFNGSVDFDPGAGATIFNALGAQDIFITKLDANGSFVWAKQIGGPSSDYAYSIAVDALSNVYTTGFFYATCDFDPGAGVANLSNAAGEDIFVSKLDALGNYVWAKQIGGSSSNANGKGISVDANGNVFTTGFYIGVVDFDPSPTASYTMSALGGGGNSHAYVSKFDAGGNFVWAANLGGPSNDEGTGITLDGSGNIFTTGYFSSTADFNPSALSYTMSSLGSTDIYLHKMGQAIPLSINEAIFGSEALIYPNPASAVITIKTDEVIETVFVYNMLGELVQKENTNTFSIEQLAKGIYILSIHTEKGKTTTRLIKE